MNNDSSKLQVSCLPLPCMYHFSTFFYYLFHRLSFKACIGLWLYSFRVFFVCSVLSIEVEDISGKGGVYIQSDGEHLGFLPKKISVHPGAIEMIV